MPFPLEEKIIMKDEFILSIDQGTSGTKAIIFDRTGKIIAKGNEPLKSYYPRPGYVEQDGNEIYKTVIKAVQACVAGFEAKGYRKENVISCGISNQRETFLLWERDGNPLTSAVVWQCKRSVDLTNNLLGSDLEREIIDRTGLIMDPYFSGTKVLHLYQSDNSLKSRIDKGTAFFGNIDTWLLFRLTGGTSYLTDYTNASRTMFFNLKNLQWDRELISDFGFNKLNMPEPRPSAGNFGKTDFEGVFAQKIPISSMIGDSHAAAFGEQCFDPGTAKATMGTGSSIMLNTGDTISKSTSGMVSTICWSLPDRTDYALEGIIVSCGSVITWLRDQMKLFKTSNDSNIMAENVEDNGGVYLIPAFSGLGAPWWKMKQKGIITGLTFQSTSDHIVRAGLESIAFQVTDVIKAMESDYKKPLTTLNVDGGITASSFILQLISDLLGKQVIRREMQEASALGAAMMAGIASGIYKSIEDLREITYNDANYFPRNSDRALGHYKEWISLLKEL